MAIRDGVSYSAVTIQAAARYSGIIFTEKCASSRCWNESTAFFQNL